MIGQKLKERYFVREELGRGGMAIVYRARDAVLRRDVALKVLHAHLADRPEARRRLRREALAAAKLSHDHILKVFDFSGEEETGPAILVTEYVRGKTLRALYDEYKDTLPCEVAALIGVVLAEALAHAHKNDIVHRDIKPENVMFRAEDGALKLMDFGIARLLDEREITQTAALLGSPAHMAPELLRGKAADFKSDIYSLGTVLYLFATGKYPFWESTPSALLRQVDQGKFRDPESVRPAVGRRLGRIIKKAMALNPEERHESAEALAEDLRAFLAEVGIEEPYAALRAFLTDIPGEAPKLKARVVEALLARAEEARRMRRKGAALSHINRVLAYEPENEAAKEILRALTQRTWGAYAVALAGVLALGAGGFFALEQVWKDDPGAKDRASAVPFRADTTSEDPSSEEPQTNEEESPPVVAESLPTQPASEPASLPFSLPVGMRAVLRPLPSREKLIKVAASRPTSMAAGNANPGKGNATPADPRSMKLKVSSVWAGDLPWTDAYLDGKRVSSETHYHELNLFEGKVYELLLKSDTCSSAPYKLEVKSQGDRVFALLNESRIYKEVVEIDCKPLPAGLRVVVEPPDVKVQVHDGAGGTQEVTGGADLSIPMSKTEETRTIKVVDLSERYDTFEATIKLTAGRKAIPLFVKLTLR